MSFTLTVYIPLFLRHDVGVYVYEVLCVLVDIFISNGFFLCMIVYRYEYLYEDIFVYISFYMHMNI